MSLLDNEYNDVEINESGGPMRPRILDCKVSKPEEDKTKGGDDYIKLDLAYKDDRGEWRYIRFCSFYVNTKTDHYDGKAIWKKFLTVCGAKNGREVEGKDIKVVVCPEPYEDKQGKTGKSYKPFHHGYFSKDGRSSTEIIENVEEPTRMVDHLERAVSYYETQSSAENSSEPESSSDEPF